MLHLWLDCDVGNTYLSEHFLTLFLYFTRCEVSGFTSDGIRRSNALSSDKPFSWFASAKIATFFHMVDKKYPI